MNLLIGHGINNVLFQPLDAFNDFVRICRRGIQFLVKDSLVEVAVGCRDMQERLQHIQQD
jgi:hypothetical protein